MKLVWDEAKRLPNLDKHGLDFAQLDIGYFESAMVLPAKLDRFIAIGWHGGELVLAVIFKPLGTEAFSIISMRHASAKEKAYV